jgi:hypothetical protein
MYEMSELIAVVENYFGLKSKLTQDLKQMLVHSR